MFKSILVPLDGSTFGEHALPLALSIARRSGALIRLVRVLPDLADRYFWAPAPGSPIETTLRKDYRSAALAYLEKVYHRVRNTAGVPVEYDLVPEKISVAESIRADVAAKNVDLVVLTSHGRGAVARFWLGSVADELVRSLNAPILLVRPPEQIVPNLERDVKLRHVLIALDGESDAEKIVEPALAIGQSMDADFTLIRVLPPPLSAESIAAESYPEGYALAASAGILETTEEQDRTAKEYLERVAARIKREGRSVRIRVSIGVQPAVAILAEAAAWADLVALETHGRRGFSRLLMGSVADKVIRGSSHPVLVCRGPLAELA
jgi:nucleotide-binding universal stress UspA family protein